MSKKVNLNKIVKDYENNYKNVEHKIVLCAGLMCIASGALKVFEELKKEIKKQGLPVSLEINSKCAGVYVSKSGCQGFCQQGPLMNINDKIFYTQVKVEDVKEIVELTIKQNKKIERLLYLDPKTKKSTAKMEEIPFYKHQERILLKDCGNTNPDDINEYIANGGYASAQKATMKMNAEEICTEISASGLRGRGGGGFLTGKKWNFARIQETEKKYIICNGDEGDPGAFMDRSIMEGNPHSVIEGMIIASQAIGADEGYVYVRMEYPLAVDRMNKAVKQAEKLGILGKNIFGSNKNFKLHVMEGAGAFVCGEETALIASVEGQRGMPRPKPPFPAESGLFGKPTIINNVETIATVPKVLAMGGKKFGKVGTETSPGTKTFALTGHIVNTGLIEVPFGTTLREVIYDIAGGVTNEKGEIEEGAFKAAQIGGPSGGCLTKKHLDLKLDYDNLKKADAMVGSGGLVVLNNTTCMVNIAKFFMQFTQHESCGKCVPCREGTKQMLTLLTDITEGKATMKTLEVLESLATVVKTASLCGLGKSAPNPVLSTIKHFRSEYIAHIEKKTCPTGECLALAKYNIDQANCKKCSLCKKVCPTDAISGEPGKTHKIDSTKCIKCGACKTACKFDAIFVGGSK
ncbi:MAG: 4Fe-4S binding protein [Elusimicrobiaceae bacterium]|jgi:NADH-quinone oxidoreductase subunit F|nr:4Fe-4S binding protein [Elusimicrobiaceae bacterium]MBT3954813.1 4Fe-4S binding protein [Elusimicrobiaceae bacterium]MBT4008807.1 4Fe-4S binding protein [Elusimicrobiaceae bacterium]MBT4402249.1 4Fe-4S binding protein [Elusimicrobiaceae bacterium]MBT4440294.1 4Fe-4S binding protein [Elusimicrobiaceae bacterium]